MAVGTQNRACQVYRESQTVSVPDVLYSTSKSAEKDKDPTEDRQIFAALLY